MKNAFREVAKTTKLYLWSFFFKVLIMNLKIGFSYSDSHENDEFYWNKEKNIKTIIFIIKFYNPAQESLSKYLTSEAEISKILVKLNSIFIFFCNHQNTVVVIRWLRCSWKNCGEIRIQISFVQEPNDCSQNCQKYCASNHQSWY